MRLRRGQLGIREAGVKDVVKRILHKLRNTEISQRLVQKVKDYALGRGKDLSHEEQRFLYRDENFGEVLPLSKKRKVDIGWTDHAEYRSELRDVDPEQVNQLIQERLRNKLPKPDHKKVKFKTPGVGTSVVDYDMMKRPADADVVTVWASKQLKRIAKSLKQVPSGQGNG